MFVFLYDSSINALECPGAPVKSLAKSCRAGPPITVTLLDVELQLMLAELMIVVPTTLMVLYSATVEFSSPTSSKMQVTLRRMVVQGNRRNIGFITSRILNMPNKYCQSQ